MRLVFVDETGDTGTKLDGGSSSGYTLGAVIVRDTDWCGSLEAIIEMRRFIKAKYGVPIREEIKANYLTRNQGWFSSKGVAPWDRREIFRYHLQLLGAASMSTFAVWIDKRKLALNGNADSTQRVAWQYLFQRLANTFPDEPVMLIHDEGSNNWIRREFRKSRSFLTAGSLYDNHSLRIDGRMLIEDPVARDSRQSYFIQLADLAAFAASQTMNASGARIRRVCPPKMWDAAGNARLRQVNGQARLRNPNLPIAVVSN